MPLTPDEERRVEELLREAAEEGRKIGGRASLRRVIAARARKLLREDYAAAGAILGRLGIAGAIAGLADLFLPASRKRWQEGMRPVLEDVAEAATEPKEEVLGAAFDVRNPNMRAWLAAYVSELADELSGTTYRQTMEVLARAQDGGWSVAKASEELRAKAGIETERRSVLIAHTELHRSSVGASLLQAQESGVVATKTWATAGDARVRDEHERMEGETVGVFEAFSNGLQFPSEPNCRCYLEFGIDWDALEAREEDGEDPEEGEGPGRDTDREPEAAPDEAAEGYETPAAVLEAEERLWRSPVEIARLYSPDGDLLLETEGEESRVAFTPEELATFAGNVLTHNHPSGLRFPEGHPRRASNSFSPADVVLAARHRLAEIRAVTPVWRHSMRPPSGGWDEAFAAGRIVPSYRRQEAAVRRELQASLERGDISVDEAEMAHFHEVWRRVSEELGMTYNRETL